MGEAAPKESSMEDILASIRRIISADSSKKTEIERREPTPAMTPAAPVTESVARKPIPAETQMPRTGSLSALAEQVRAERSGNMQAPMKSAPPTVSPTPETKSMPSNEPAKPASATASSPLGMPSAPTAKPGSLADIASQVAGRTNSLASEAKSEAALALSALSPKATSLSDIASQVTGRSNTPVSEVRSELAPAPKSEISSPTTASAAKVEEKPVESAKPATTGNGAPAGMSLKELADRVAKSADKIDAAELTQPKDAAVSVQPSTPDQVSEVKPGSLASIAASVATANPESKPAEKVERAELSASTKPASETPVAVTKPRLEEKPAEPDEASVKAFKEAMVSPSTQAAVTNSMDRLRKAVEDIDTAQVENILRPMLKSWLDENLPSMVERMVQEEISKITAKK